MIPLEHFLTQKGVSYKLGRFSMPKRVKRSRPFFTSKPEGIFKENCSIFLDMPKSITLSPKQQRFFQEQGQITVCADHKITGDYIFL
jgi:hypothetical protein